MREVNSDDLITNMLFSLLSRKKSGDFQNFYVLAATNEILEFSRGLAEFMHGLEK